ncbi:MAG: SET domain-containing protein-lysine N-methyltransferase [Candidatus Pelagibacter sp. TMED64]|nr:SET domain-containing protein-lysine N-methyltransferase [Candidatus Pelagibacter sp.]OUU67708.1 MAG: SET domain-containing protein-lysine N-methyltransferase [Candidatus Pelagibacter sp. TMED64]|tara:strand:+ start:6074 stop:6529 length:456 start_codon:yes stop_codon:yes gene_type:complete
MRPYKIIKSNIHQKGLCAARNIKQGEKIIQYVGKKITNKQAEKDDKYGYNITYLFTLNEKYLIDGDFKYNTARLINHSCDPNCEVLDSYKKEIWVTAMKDIKKNEELSYDYGFSYDKDYKDHKCKCGSKNCVGYILREGSRWRLKKKIINI